MDRRSWLWRRKSSEKSAGETDSSGSISSHSERFSDDQACPTHSQSPEFASKSITTGADEEVNDNVRALTEKLSAALANISSKEDLVKQHAKVAEEAVSGWEKAEKEMVALRQQLDAAVKKNLSLEDRVGHLDGALKECVRQLRQAREEQEQRIFEAVAKKSVEWEAAKAELEGKLLDIEAQLQTAKTGTAFSPDADLNKKLETIEKENTSLKLELLSRAEELELRIVERDLSTLAAEAASKQHLESIKKLAKLEAECRRLNAIAHQVSSVNDRKSNVASSPCIESFTDSLSDSGERSLAVESDMQKTGGMEMNEHEASRSGPWMSSVVTDLDHLRDEKAVGRNIMAPLTEINLMDDFLEMEKLAALPDLESFSGLHMAGPISNQENYVASSSKSEIEALINRTADLEEKLETMEAEKHELTSALVDSQKQLETSQTHLEETMRKWTELLTQLAYANNSMKAAEEDAKAAKVKLDAAESRTRDVEMEKLELKMAITESQKQLETAQNQLKEAERKSAELQTQLAHACDSAEVAEEDLKAVNKKIEVTELRLREVEVERLELEMALSESQKLLEASQGQLQEAERTCTELQRQLGHANNSAQAAEEEVKAANIKKYEAESKCGEMEVEKRTLLEKVSSLEEEVEKEIAFSAETISMCKKLEDELSKMKCEVKFQINSEFHHAASNNENFKVKQDKELAVAASRLAECQKTIASLGKQLKSLATLEDFLVDSDTPQLPIDAVLQYPRNGEAKCK